MRRKPSSQGGGYNNQRKQRYQGGGSQGGSHHNHGGHNRPRKNYPAMREKYLNQARDALASGDRVLAENYLQHADHCYRMMMEEGAHRQQFQQQQAQTEQPQAQPMEDGNGQDFMPQNTSQLPAFLTATYEQPAQPPVDPATIQNWEERDA